MPPDRDMDDRPPESRASVPGKFFGLVKSTGEISREILAHGPGAFWRMQHGAFGMIVPIHESYDIGFVATPKSNATGLPGIIIVDIYFCPHKRPADQVCWNWNGLDEKATLTPSIYPVGYWHGYLTDGNLVSV